MDCEHFLSDYGKRIGPSVLREMARLIHLKDPNIIYLGGGVPNPNTFPFESMKMKLRDGSVIELDENDLSKALQYAPADGLPEAMKEVKKLIKTYHDPPVYEKLKFCFSSGSQEAMFKAFQVIFNAGEYIVVPNPVYPGVLGILRPLHVKTLAIHEDDQGMKTDELRRCLLVNKEKTIKAIYVNSSSSNPSGITCSLNRRKEIYQIAKEFNLIIIEDDPYYFLSFEEGQSPSLLSLDTDGRVLRFDSFSKIISPGMRLGFISGPPTLVTKIEYTIQTSTQQASSLSQMIICSLLKKWGENGLQQHLARIRSFYKSQAQCAIENAEKWLKGLAEWYVPKGGMFVWIKILNVKDTKKLVLQSVASNGVFVVPGNVFVPDGKDSPYIRLSYSMVSQNAIDEAFKRLAAGIRDYLNHEQHK